MRTLNLTDAEIVRAGELLTGFLRQYEGALPDKPVLPPLDRTILAQLLTQPFPDEGIGIDQLFAEIESKVLPNSTAIAHSRYLAYVLPPPNGIAPFAEAIAAALNQNCNFWQLSPAANVIEGRVISWLASLFGYPSTSGGLLTSGGSMATLTALSTAIHDRGPADFRQSGLQCLKSPLVIYTSDEVHRCVEKDAVLLGLGLDHVRKIATDDQFKMRVDALASAVREDRQAGKHPVCVVASAGTINTGAIDPIGDLADFCARENLWLHVDGAYGGLFILSSKMGSQLLDSGRADSIALDPHKMLFAPLEAGCLLVRDRQTLRRAFQFQSSYLTADDDPLLSNYLEYGPQLSRSFKAFKIWCSLQALGVNAFTAAVEHSLEIARYMAEQIQADKRFELLAPVTLSAVCFRLAGYDDMKNRQALVNLVASGTALLGPVTLRGRFGIRACIANYRTERSDIDLILRTLLEQ